MGRILKNELYRGFINKRFFFIIAVEICIVAAHVFINVLPIAVKTVPLYQQEINHRWVRNMPGAYYTWLGIMTCPIHLMLMAILPLLAAVPYGDSLYIDEQNRYIYHINTRAAKKKYYAAKLLAMFITGGTAAAFPYLLSFLVNIAILPMETVIPSSFVYLSNIECLSGLFYKSPFLYVIAYLFFTFIGFGILNCLCFVATYILSNRFLVILFPFVVDYLMLILGDLFEVKTNMPWIYLNFNVFWKSDIPAAVIHFSIFLFIIIAAYLYKSSRKVDAL